VLLSLVYRLVRCLLGLMAVLVRSDLSKDAELLVLCHENQVLRPQGTQTSGTPHVLILGEPSWSSSCCAAWRVRSLRTAVQRFVVAPGVMLR
jgi:hypothetical protein